MTKVGSGHIKGEYFPTLEDVHYRNSMRDALLEKPRFKPNVPEFFNGKPVKDLTSEEREEFIFSMQPQSTQQAILRQKKRDPKDDLDYILRPLAPCVANPDATNKDELTAKRNLDPRDIDLHHSALNGKNTFGQSDEGSVDSAKRQKGIEAFTYSKPAELTLAEIKKVTKLEEIKSTPLEPEKPKKSGWFKKIFGIKSNGYTWAPGGIPEKDDE